jgi:hypothetical protein
MIAWGADIQETVMLITISRWMIIGYWLRQGWMKNNQN